MSHYKRFRNRTNPLITDPARPTWLAISNRKIPSLRLRLSPSLSLSVRASFESGNVQIPFIIFQRRCVEPVGGRRSLMGRILDLWTDSTTAASTSERFSTRDCVTSNNYDHNSHALAPRTKVTGSRRRPQSCLFVAVSPQTVTRRKPFKAKGKTRAFQCFFE